MFSRSSVNVYNNSAHSGGGASFLYKSRVCCQENSTVNFNYNKAKFGGTVYGHTNHFHVSFREMIYINC